MAYVAKTKKRKYYKDNVYDVSPYFYNEAQATQGLVGSTGNVIKFLTRADLWNITLPYAGSGVPNNSVITLWVGINNGIVSIGYKGSVISGSQPSVIMKNVQCSSDGVNWVTISSSFGNRYAVPSSPLMIPQPNTYAYIRFTAYPDDSGFSKCNMYNLQVKYIATPKYEVSADEPYDYYTDYVTNYVAKTKKRKYYKETTVINTSTPGTYKFTPIEDTLCRIRIIGPGAGGAFNSSSNRSSAAAGGSGAGGALLAVLKGGITYALQVGSGGPALGGLDATATGGRGSPSALLIDGGATLAVAEGGIGGNVWWPNGQSQGAPAPEPYYTEFNDAFLFKKWIFKSKGNPGGIGGNPSAGGASVIPNEFNGIMGRGGDAWNAGGSSRGATGYNGYVQLIYLKEVSADEPYDTYEDTEKAYIAKRKARKYYKYVNSVQSGYVGIGELEFTADYASGVIESTNNDYDYYIDTEL